MNQFEFLSSNRFWALVLGSASAVLVSSDFMVEHWWVSLGKFLGLLSAGFITLRTVDRATEVLSNRTLPVEKADEAPEI